MENILIELTNRIMKIEELRVGNLIYFPFHNENVKVLGLGLKNDLSKLIQVETKGTILMDRLICFKPIPLTEEWLLKFGFVNNNTIEYPNYTKGFYTCLWRNGKTNICNNHGFIKDLKYVHQLQNLYFALTEKELCEVR